MLNTIKAVLAPSQASWGMLKYWKGQYEAAYRYLNRAYKWNPEIFEDSVFEGYLGLTLCKMGDTKNGIQRIIAADKYLDKVATHNKDIREIEKDLINEMRGVLNDNAI